MAPAGRGADEPQEAALEPTATSVRRLRIAHVTATFPPYYGGTGNVAFHNAREVASRGHDVHVITAGAPSEKYPSEDVLAGDSESTAVAHGVTVHRLPARYRVGNAPLLPGLPRMLDGFDLVHLHYPFYFGGEQVWWQCRRRRTPYVVTYHQDVLFSWPWSLAARMHHTLLGAHIVARAQTVIATTLDYAHNSRLARLPARQIVEVPNGVDIDRFRPGRDTGAMRRRHGIAEGTPVVLFVGGLDRAHFFKGITVLLAAFEHVPDAVLLIVGDGELRPAYARQAHAAGLQGRVRFAGRVGADDLPDYYALADITVLPSTTGGEAFGLVSIEAMATGRPVIASRLPGVRAVVDDGETGLLATAGDPTDLAEKLVRLLGSPELRLTMGKAGRRKAEERYAWPEIGRQLEQLYVRVVAMAARTA